MDVGVEIIDGTIAAAIPLLRDLRDVVQIVKVRRREHLDAILGEVGPFHWLLRGPSEGRNADEIVRDHWEWQEHVLQIGQEGACTGYVVANEPNHPSAPWGHSGAGEYVQSVLRPALQRIGVSAFPLYQPPSVPYFGTAAWAAAYDAFPELLPSAHCYQNGGDIAGAVGDALAQAGQKPIGQVIADEVGDTSGDRAPVRALRTAEQFARLARAGVRGAILFPLVGTGEWTAMGFDLPVIRTILDAGRLTRPGRTRRQAVPNFQFGFAEYAAAHPEVGEPVMDEMQLAPGIAFQMTSTGVLWFAQAAADNGHPPIRFCLDRNMR